LYPPIFSPALQQRLPADVVADVGTVVEATVVEATVVGAGATVVVAIVVEAIVDAAGAGASASAVVDAVSPTIPTTIRTSTTAPM
jgi:hypothetical protein